MSSFANAPGTHLQNLVLDANVTHDDRVACLKMLRIIVKNLCDTNKVDDPKYRQLKLSNEKVRSRMVPCYPHSLEYFKSLGFVSTSGGGGVDGSHTEEGKEEEVGEECLRLPYDAFVVSNAMASLAELDDAINSLVPEGGSSGSVVSVPPAARERDELKKSSSSTSTVRISEKERARMLLEKKRQSDAKDAKDARRRTTELIKQGEFLVRERGGESAQPHFRFPPPPPSVFPPSLVRDSFPHAILIERCSSVARKKKNTRQIRSRE